MSDEARIIKGVSGGVVAFIAAAIVLAFCIETVSTGHYAAGTRFGRPTDKRLEPGIHLVDPRDSWDHYNALNRAHEFEAIIVPAADQQAAALDVAIQYRIMPTAITDIRKKTGTESELLSFVTPKVRGVLRDAGRGTKKVEHFYDDQQVLAYRRAALGALQETLVPYGFEVTDVIVRKVALPQGITVAIEAKKQREQEVEKERAELDRVALQAQQKVKQAEADLEAERLNAEAVRVAAEAKAFKIEKLQRQLAQSPNYIELVKAERWNGGVPNVMAGADTGFLFQLDSKSQ